MEEELLEAGIIRQSRSPWASLSIVVPKPCGKVRFCIDYRQQNSITKPEYPIPNIES